MKALDEGKALVVFSGGQDSTACLGWAIKKWGAKSLLALTFDYGQRHKVEIDVARDIAARLGAEHTVFAFDLFARLGGSALVQECRSVNETADGLPASFVPGRNILFLTVASAIAYKNNIANIVMGVSSVDYSGYPDCRPEFIASMAESLARGFEANVKIHAPLQNKNKAETFMLAEECGVLREALDSHTCYEGVRDREHPWGRGCGKCPACVLREKGYNEFISIKGQG
ncbi:MAG: 7-cyano-7-deazaguanine synthase QueC [Pseudomonadota bacterium]